MTELFHQILDWVTLHPLWAGVIIFAVSLSESLAVIGLIVPGVVIMFGIGALIATGAIPFWPAMAWAVAGAVAGDGLSFWLGFHFRDRLRNSWPFSRHPQSLERGISFFQKYGGKSVAFGRFFGPVRAVIPLVAGMMGMPAHRFLVANILSALAWAPAYLLPGMVFGASLELASEVAFRLVVIIVLLAAIVWFSFWFIRLLFRLIQPHSQAIIQFLLDWSTIHPKLGTIAAALADPEHPEAKGLSILATLLVITTALFVLIFSAVLQGGALTSLDQMLLQLLQSLRTPLIDHLMVTVTRLADSAIIFPVMIAVLLYLLWQRHYRSALYWLAAAAFAIIVPPLLKYGLQIPRPDVIQFAANSYSFPSGHTLKAMVIYGFLSVIIAWSIAEKWRWVPYTAAGLIILGVGLSRLYLGAHWLSDVLGSLTLGLAWVASLGIAYRRHSIPESNWKGMTLLLLAIMGISMTTESTLHHSQQVVRYTPVPEIRTLNEDQWWQSSQLELPKSRSDIRNRQNHPLNLQYAGHLDTLSQALARQGWRNANLLDGRNVLHLLATGLPLDELPVLPQVHDGRHEVLVLTKMLSDGTRRVLRLWPADVILTPDESSLWIGNVSDQGRAEVLHLIAFARTLPDFEQPLADLAKELAKDKRMEIYKQGNRLQIRPDRKAQSKAPDAPAQLSDH